MKREEIERRELWRWRTSEQESTDQAFRAFCREHGLSESTFYAWRKLLRQNPVTSATAKPMPAPPPSDAAATHQAPVSTAPRCATEHPETRRTDPPSPVRTSPRNCVVWPAPHLIETAGAAEEQRRKALCFGPRMTPVVDRQSRPPSGGVPQAHANQAFPSVTEYG